MQFIGELCALATAFCWSAGSFAFTAAAKRLGSIQLNINRLILALIFLSITIAALGLSFQLSGTQIFYLAVSGVIGFVFGDTFLFKAFQYIGARISMLLMSLSPIISGLLAFFFLNEVISGWGIFGIIVTLVGVALVIVERKETPDSKYKKSKVGIIYGLLGSLGQAGGLIFAKAAFNAGEINGFVATFIRIAGSIIILLPIVLLTHRYKNPVLIFSRDLKALRSTVLGTILGPYLGVTFSLIAVEHTKVGIAATLMSTMPIIMLPIARYVYKEKLNWQAVTGAFLAVAGVSILFLK
ncbi:MAG: DMT family transporter [Ignavibacteriaceae bacterium]